MSSYVLLSYALDFSAQDRRRIEAEAFSGNLLGIVATNALELGVDIGSLDAVLVHGFPPTVASFVRVLLPQFLQYAADGQYM